MSNAFTMATAAGVPPFLPRFVMNGNVWVERSTFESRMSGYPKLYRLFFEKPDEKIQHVTYDWKGKKVDGFDFWFNQTGREPTR